jgi:hypothetical protein
MKRLRLLVLLGAIAVALPFALLSGVASATGGGSTNQVSINQNAQYDTLGGIIHVGLRVRCAPQSTPGLVEVHVKQSPPQVFVEANGDGFNPEVVCDGATHSVGVTVFVDGAGGPFDAGTALATATLTPTPLSPTTTAQRKINIIVMPS